MTRPITSLAALCLLSYPVCLVLFGLGSIFTFYTFLIPNNYCRVVETNTDLGY